MVRTLVVLLLMVVATAASTAEKITICLLPKKKGLAYFTSCNEGAQAAAKELNDGGAQVEVVYDGPTDGSPEKAVQLIEKWTLKKVDVIAVSPNDPDVLAPAMKAARAKGIKVITWDSDGHPDARDLFVNQATAQQIGGAMVDAMASDLGAEPAGQVAIVSATLTAANQNAWIEHMKVRLTEKYPKLELVGVKPSNEDQKQAFQVSQDLLKAYPDLKGIFGISSVSFPGAAEAVKQAGKTGQVMVTGLSTPNAMKEFVQGGTVRSVVLWDTRDLGYLAVHTAYQLATGALTADASEITAGRLGVKQIADGNVLLDNLIVFTKDNIGEYDF